MSSCMQNVNLWGAIAAWLLCICVEFRRLLPSPSEREFCWPTRKEVNLDTATLTRHVQGSSCRYMRAVFVYIRLWYDSLCLWLIYMRFGLFVAYDVDISNVFILFMFLFTYLGTRAQARPGQGPSQAGARTRPGPKRALDPFALMELCRGFNPV